MKLTAAITAIAFTLAPALVFGQDTVELSKEEARKCEVCVDQYDVLKREALDLEADYNQRAGQLKECRQTVGVLTFKVDKQGRDLGKLQEQKQDRLPKWAFYVPTAIAVLLAAGWGYDKLSGE